MLERKNNETWADAAKEAPSLRQSALPPIDYQALREEVGIGAVLELLGFHAVSRHGDQLRGPCPIHHSSNERSRSFSVNLAKNAYRCFSPSCGSQGNQIDLFAAAVKLPLLQAAHELCACLGIRPPRLERQGNNPNSRHHNRR
jgi:hypothetical protein